MSFERIKIYRFVCDLEGNLKRNEYSAKVHDRGKFTLYEVKGVAGRIASFLYRENTISNVDIGKAIKTNEETYEVTLLTDDPALAIDLLSAEICRYIGKEERKLADMEREILSMKKAINTLRERYQ